MRLIAIFVLLHAPLGCTMTRAGDVRVTTFGTAQVEVRDGERTITASGDGTNVFGIVAKVVDTARRFFGGGDTIIQTTPQPAPPEPPL